LLSLTVPIEFVPEQLCTPKGAHELDSAQPYRYHQAAITASLGSLPTIITEVNWREFHPVRPTSIPILVRPAHTRTVCPAFADSASKPDSPRLIPPTQPNPPSVQTPRSVHPAGATLMRRSAIGSHRRRLSRIMLAQIPELDPFRGPRPISRNRTWCASRPAI
jgi:hypothetical protein